MRRVVIGLCLVAGFALMVSPALFSFPLPKSPNAQDAEKDHKSTSLTIAKVEDDSPLGKIYSRANFRGISDEKATFIDALDALKELYKVRFTINEKAFEFEGRNLTLIRECLIAEVKPIAAVENARLDMILGRILKKLPSSTGATFLIRRDCFEITTEKFARNEIWGNTLTAPCLYVVHARFDSRPLDEVLSFLGDEADFTIVVDKGLGEKVKTPVTAKFYNTPLDTAVQILASIADALVVHRDNVLFVTTPSRAATLEKKYQAEKPREQKKSEIPSPWRKGGDRRIPEEFMLRGVQGM